MSFEILSFYRLKAIHKNEFLDKFNSFVDSYDCHEWIKARYVRPRKGIVVSFKRKLEIRLKAWKEWEE